MCEESKIQYIRDEKHNPVITVVWEVSENQVLLDPPARGDRVRINYAWAKCNPIEPFDKAKGKLIARGRLNVGTCGRWNGEAFVRVKVCCFSSYIIQISEGETLLGQTAIFLKRRFARAV